MKLPVSKEQKVIFNLIATLVQDCIALDDYKRQVTTAYRRKEEIDEWDRIDVFLRPYHEELKDAITDGMSTESATTISEWCKTGKGVLTYTIALSQIDRFIDYDLVFDVWEGETFESLNDNNAQILVELRDHHTATQAKQHIRKTAYKWKDPFEDCLHNVFVIQRMQLWEDGIGLYRVRHYMVGGIFPANTKGINFGVSPLINRKLTEIMDIEYDSYQNSFGNYVCVFRLKEILNKAEIEYAVRNAYHVASLREADVLIMPEMLGYPELSEPQEDGYNLLLRELVTQHRGSTCPRVVLMPTCWHNNQNVLYIYSREGKLLLSQCKQHPFILVEKEQKYEEHLLFQKNEDGKEEREISILHIQQVGRFAFPICIDYLIPSYRSLMVEQLKADFLLCPSYTFGSANFELASFASLEYGVRTIWCNTCSACRKEETVVPTYVGTVCLPAIGEVNPQLRLTPQSDQCCHPGCLFQVCMPLNCANQEDGRQDLRSVQKHFVADAE